MRRASLTPTVPLTSTALRRTNSETPEDEYDYKDAGPSVSATNPKQRSEDLSSVLTGDVSDDPDGFVGVGEPKTNIFEKSISGNRAKLPDDFNRGGGNQPTVNGRPTAPPTAPAPRRRRRRDFFRTFIPGREPRPAENTTLRKIDLHWSREEVEGAEKVSLNVCTNNDTASGPTTSVLWQ